MFAVLAGVSFTAQTLLPVGAMATEYSQELQDAYSWAYSKGVTTMSSIDNANMYGAITRAEMAKMLSVYATEILGMTPDTTKACSFTDIDSVKGDLHEYIIESCQLGVMGQGITAFRPYDTISRAEFGTALSRVLWGDKYEGGTPYYANHLNALKAAGIMNQIANAEGMKEIRGYVMLMLMRSDEGGTTVDCSDPAIELACELDSDKCPAECKEGAKDEDKVVKSGDLAVEATAAGNTKILATGTSDLDTITFKTSEEVSISKITLERYGYSKSEQIEGIWLEDEDGNVIADSKSLTKDKVTLNLKKDYKTVDGKFVATVVVKTNGAEGTMGFKVTDVESSAKNLNLDDYAPHTYDVVAYVGSNVTVEMKGSNKTYNYEEGESYEIARVKVAAGDNAVIVKGFTLTNAGKVDMKESLDELTVKVDSKEVKAKYSVNKDDELVVTFTDGVELGINKRATFILSASFKDFNDYGEAITYYIAEDSDFNATESKNGTRVNLNWDNAKKTSKTLATYTFNGGKIKLSNKKLGNVDAAQASEGTVIAEWDITVTEPISKINFTLTVSSIFADKLTMIVNGDEYEGTNRTVNATPVYTVVAKPSGTYCSWTSPSTWTVVLQGGNVSDKGFVKVHVESENTGFNNKDYYINLANKTDGAYDLYDANKNLIAGCDGTWVDVSHIVVTPTIKNGGETTFDFKNVSIEKSGKIQFTVDIVDDETAAGTFQVTPAFGSAQLSGAKYDNVSKQYVNGGDVAGSISFSKVTIQPAKAALENNLTKDVEFLKDETSRKTVFEGTYTAKKGAIDLNKFTVTANSNPLVGKNKVTFYLSVDGEEVADTDTLNSEESFSDVRVNAGESVKVKVEAEVEAYDDAVPSSVASYQIELKGTDMNGNEDTGRGSERLMNIKIKAKGSVTIPSTTEAKTALLKAANTTVAKFTIKPSNGNEGIMLEDFVLEATNWGTPIPSTDLRVKVGGTEQDDDSLTYSVNEELPTEWLVVEVILKKETAGKIKITVKKVNDKDFNSVYEKYLVESLVTFVKQNEWSSSTEYTLNVEHSDDAYAVKNFKVFAYSGSTCKNGVNEEIKKITTSLADDESFTIMRWDKAQEICEVSYEVWTGTLVGTVNIDKDTYKDYFKVGGTELSIPKA